MSWWNDVWLNEGFATYMQYMSLQAVMPKLDIVGSHTCLRNIKAACFSVCLPVNSVCLQGNLFLAVRFRALDKDALNSSHAVSTEVNKPEQVEEMFDSVSYEKVRFLL